MEVLLILLVAAYVIGLPIAALVALSKARRSEKILAGINRAIAELWQLSAALHEDIEAIRRRLGAPPAPEPKGPPPDKERPIEHPAEVDESAAPREPEGARPVAEPAAPRPEPVTGAGATSRQTLEEAITSRWLVWLGAISIALGGTFLVKYAIDNDWLGPATRVTLGFILGVALTVGGEWLRRRPLQLAIAAIRSNYVPPALTASGLFTAFTSAYAAYGLYDLVNPLLAFGALAAVALAAMGLSLLQGWFVALMGLLGGFVTPAIVDVGEPSAWTLFPYLLVIELACLGVVRYMAWPGLAYATLAGAAAWPALWLLTYWTAPDMLPLGIYLLLVSAAFLYFRRGLTTPERAASWLGEMRALIMPEWVAWIAACTFSVLAFALVRVGAYGVPSLVFLGLFCVLYLGTGRREAVFDGLAVVAAVLTLALMATWHLPDIVAGPEPLYRIGGKAFEAPHGPIVPPALALFTATGTIFGGLFAIGGFIALWGAKRPAVWAGVSAGTIVLMLVIAYWRFVDFGLDLRWSVVSFVLAAACLAAAARVNLRRGERGLADSLGFYAAAVTAFVSLGATMTLQQAWLTVALAVELPALGLIAVRVPVRSIRVIAATVAVVVLVRLVLNFDVLDYPLGARPLFGWVLYGYGIPAIMFFWAAHIFRRTATDMLVTLLEAGGVAFCVLLVSLQIRVLVPGSLDSSEYSLLEQSLQSAAWLSIAYVLRRRYRAQGHRVSYWGSRILMGAAVAQIVLLQLWHSNPIQTQEFIGEYPVVNLLFLAYAVPALFAFMFSAELKGATADRAAKLVGGLGFLLMFTYISLEVRRAFQGPVLQLMHQSDAEFYAYSIAWLLYAAALFGVGIYTKIATLRYASLVVLLITAIKVFVFDMADLTGLYRVASFLGLGLSLVVIGHLYQRYVFPVRRPHRA